MLELQHQSSQQIFRGEGQDLDSKLKISCPYSHMLSKSSGVWTLETSSSLWSRLGDQGREVRMMWFAPEAAVPASDLAWLPAGVAGICYFSGSHVLIDERRLWSETVGFKFQLSL